MSEMEHNKGKLIPLWLFIFNRYKQWLEIDNDIPYHEYWGITKDQLKESKNNNYILVFGLIAKLKGIPFDKLMEEVNEYENCIEWFLDYGPDYNFEFINNVLYYVEWEVESVYDPYFVDVNRCESGIIEFHTLHYNGGAHWTELIENKLKQ